jgi:DNA polymerase-3 subunit gamma/tau
MFERMLRCCDELGKTLQPRLVLDCALIDVATIEPLVPLGDLIERLTDLEGRLAGRPARAGGGGGTKDRPRPVAPSSTTRSPAPPVRTAAPDALAGSPRGSTAHGSTAAAATGAGAGAAAAASSHAAPDPSAGAGSPSPSSAITSGQSVSAGAVAMKPHEPEGARSEGSLRAAESAVPVAAERSAPISMQPSGPVPRPEAVAAGSGPHDHTVSPAKLVGVPANAGEALLAWDGVLDELERLRNAALAALYRHARVLTWTADQLELGFPVDAHSMGEMAKDHIGELRAIVRTLGPELKNIKVAVRLLDASESNTTGARSILEDTRERTSAERTKREAEARAHPITKHVLQTFGAQIKEIKTDV